MTTVMAQLEYLTLTFSYFHHIFPAHARGEGGYGCVGLAVGVSSALST